MLRNIMTICGGIVLSLLLYALCSGIALHFTTFGKLSLESFALGRFIDDERAIAKYGDPFEAAERALRLIEYGLFPIAAILVGIYVGLLTKTKALLISGTSVLPFIVIATSSEQYGFAAFLRVLLYLSLCCFSTFLIARLRSKGNSPDNLPGRKPTSHPPCP